MLFRESGKEEGKGVNKEREKKVGCLLHAPRPGPGMEPATQESNLRTFSAQADALTMARAVLTYFVIHYYGNKAW